MYKAVDIEVCVRKKHRLRIFGSDKTPLKLNILCLDCTHDAVTAVAAYGTDVGSWGSWKRVKKDRESEED